MLQLLRAANMVVSSARFLRSLKEEVLAPEVYHLDPKVSDTESFRRFVRCVCFGCKFWLSLSLTVFELIEHVVS